MAFNAESFLQQTVEAKLSTKRIPHPDGIFDEGQIVDLQLKSGTAKESGKQWARLEVIIQATDPAIREEMKLPEGQEAKVRFECFLDLDENNNLDVSEGKNIQLGKLRNAAGQNSDESWSIMDLKSAVVGYKVKHRFNEDGDAYAVCSSVFNPEGDVEDEDE